MHRHTTLVDCTIRDGGLLNRSNFTLDFVTAVYRALCRAGIDIVELGYRNSRRKEDPGQHVEIPLARPVQPEVGRVQSDGLGGPESRP
jgi:isopropylmalate/homocitrate/citramalate synthase